MFFNQESDILYKSFRVWNGAHNNYAKCKRNLIKNHLLRYRGHIDNYYAMEEAAGPFLTQQKACVTPNKLSV